MRPLERDGAEERGAICESIPVIVPPRTWCLAGTFLGGHRFPSWNMGPLGISRLGKPKGIELVDILLCWSDAGKAILDSVLASERKMGWHTEGEHFDA